MFLNTVSASPVQTGQFPEQNKSNNTDTELLWVVFNRIFRFVINFFIDILEKLFI
jgi:hypothetical protein